VTPRAYGNWSRRYDRCAKCGTTERHHRARGLCTLCYERRSYARAQERGITARRIRGDAKVGLTRAELERLYVQEQQSLGDIAQALGCTRQYIHGLLHDYGIPRRSLAAARSLALRGSKLTRVDASGIKIVLAKKEFDEHFFSKWSRQMAYVLGVMCTDGCLIEPTSKRRIPLITLAQKERELLDKTLALMRARVHVGFSRERLYGHIVAGSLFHFEIGSERLFSDLVALGITPRKSLTLRWPDMPSEYVRHFIRGCWDGDGSVSFRRRNPRQITASFVSGSLDFVEGMRDALIEAGFSKRTIYVTPQSERRPRRSYSIKLFSRECRLLFRYLYDGVGAAEYLDRKHAVFADHLSSVHPGEDDRQPRA
jgi:hypothetical protein